MKAQGSRLVYEAAPLTLPYAVLAVTTLFALFLLTLAYLVIVPLLLWQLWASPSVWLATLITLALSSPLWSWRSGPWRAFGRTLGFEAWRRYFGFRVYRAPGPEAWTSPVLVALVPHGLFPLELTLLSAIQEQVFPEFGSKVPRTAVASAMLMTPVLAPMLRWFGCIPATRKDIHATLASNGNCLIVPDGIAGAFHSHSEQEQLYLSTRFGFIKTALQEGATLVPAYCYGHTQLWDVWPKHDSWVASLSRKLQFSLIWFVGEWWCPPLPRRKLLTLVVGNGMALPKKPHPTDDEIRSTLQRFQESVSRLYYSNRHLAGPDYEDKALVIL